MAEVVLPVVSFNIRFGTARDGMHRWEFRRRALAQRLGQLPWQI